MKKLIVLIGIIALILSCDNYMPGDLAHINEDVEQKVFELEEGIAILINATNHELKLNLNNTSYTILKEDGIFAVVEPDGRLLAVCNSFFIAKEIIIEHNKINKSKKYVYINQSRSD